MADIKQLPLTATVFCNAATLDAACSLLRPVSFIHTSLSAVPEERQPLTCYQIVCQELLRCVHLCCLCVVQSEVGSMGAPLQFVKLYKSGGVVQRTPAARQAARSNRIKEYFYGTDNSLTPVSVNMNAANMMVFRTGRSLGEMIHICSPLLLSTAGLKSKHVL